MADIYLNVVSLLKEVGVAYKQHEHEPVFTAEQAAAVSKHSESEGTKSVVLEAKGGDLVVVTVCGDERIDFKVIKQKLDKKVSMCTPDVLRKRLGVEVGGVVPFGFGPDVSLIVSGRLFKQQTVYINPGRNDMTISMSGWDFQRIMKHAGAIVL